MTFDEFITKAEETVTKGESILVTLAALVDKADSAVDFVPAGVLPENLKEARAALDMIRTYMDQAAAIIEGAKANGT